VRASAAGVRFRSDGLANRYFCDFSNFFQASLSASLPITESVGSSDQETASLGLGVAATLCASAELGF
jgi:hypothetical protein